jgi:hypothetical protein
MKAKPKDSYRQLFCNSLLPVYFLKSLASCKAYGFIYIKHEIPVNKYPLCKEQFIIFVSHY